MDAGRPGLDHGLHQLKGVERPAEARLGVGDDGREPVRLVLILQVIDVIGPLQGIVDPFHQIGHTVGRIKTLVGIGLPRGVVVAGHLPAADVNGLETGLHLLDGLVAGDGPQSSDEILLLHQPPQPLGPHAGQRILDLH